MGCGGGKSAQPANTSAGAGKGKKDSMPKKETKEGGISHAKFILDNKGNVRDSYEIEKKKLGEGSYGSVSKAKAKTNGAAPGAVRAVKTICKERMKNVEQFKQEIAIMKMMDHPNIIRLYETFEDHRNVYLVMELCAGGELFDRIIQSGHFTEAQAATLMKQIIQAVFYMHENKVCHRDLKPENFLFTTEESIEKNLLKIIDFGLSCSFKPDQVLTTKAGTPYYVAPQVLAGKYDHLSDLWSCGVIMFVMLCGYPPFSGETDADVLSKVRLGNYSFNAADWQTVSEDAKNLICELLKMEPKDRYTAEQALNHEWIKNKAPKATVNLNQEFVNNLHGFMARNKLKKAALHIIAGQLNENQIKALRDMFMALDGNGDGLLTINEMKQGITKAGLKEIPSDLQQIMEKCDSDGTGVIDYTEFLAATLDKRVYIKEDVCWTAFRIFDTNGNGKISPDELKQVLGDADVKNVVGEDKTSSLIKQIDCSGDGSIDFKEFMAMMKQE